MRSRPNAKALRDADPGNRAPIPVDLVTASASGLDPEISPAAAAYQVARVARARGIALGRRAAADRGAHESPLGSSAFLGEPASTCLELNLAAATASRRRVRTAGCHGRQARAAADPGPAASTQARAQRRARARRGAPADLLRRLGRRRQDLRDARGGAHARATRARTSSSATSSRTAASRPSGCSRVSSACRRCTIAYRGIDAPGVRSRRRAAARARRRCSSTSSPTRTSSRASRARATPSAGRTSRNCSMPASTSGRRSTSSTSRA